MAEGEIIGQEVEGGGGNYRAFLLRCWQVVSLQPLRRACPLKCKTVVRLMAWPGITALTAPGTTW